MNKYMRNKKIKYITGSVGAVTLAVAACTAGSYTGTDVVKYDTDYLAGETTASETDANTVVNTDDLADKLAESIDMKEKEVDKDETVYVFAKANGDVDHILVNETLKNRDKQDTIHDQTELADIVNVKGDETFTQDGNHVTWEAKGNAISYQGTTDKALPVSVKATYYLDGEEISPEDLAGKSGQVKIRLDYTNNEKVTKNINGKDEEISVPFVAVSGMVLGNHFQNISVTNGKTISQGESTIVVGYAMPGFEDGAVSEGKDSDTTFPDYVEVSADVTDFSLDMTVTLLVNGSEMDISGGIDLTDIDELTESVSSAGNQLEEGSGQLSEGAGDLSKGAGTLASKMGDLTSGAGSLKEGMSALAGKSGDLTSGIGVINQSAQSIANGINTLDAAVNADMTEPEKQQIASTVGTTVAANVEAQFAQGTDTYNQIYNQASTSYANSITAATDQIAQAYISSDAYSAFYNAALCAQATNYAMQNAPALMQAYGIDYQTAFSQAYNGALQSADMQAAVASSVQDAMKQMASQTTASLAEGGKAAIGQSVVDACKQSATQAAAQAAGQAAVQSAQTTKKTIASQIEAVQENGYSLVSGANALAQGTSTLAGSIPALEEGISQLVNGANALANGSIQLQDGANKLADGATEVADGAGTLNDSLVTLNNEAIKKMVRAYNGDVKDSVRRLQAAMEAATEYDSFGGKSPEAAGVTKFIIKTEAISAESR